MALIHLAPLSRRVTKGQLLQFFCTAGGIEGKRVGKIELSGSTAVIEAPDEWEARLIKALDGAMMDGRRLRAWSRGASAPSSDGEDHFQRLARLLELEGQAEAEQARTRMDGISPADAERQGDCLVGLVVVDESAGLGGRCLLSLAKRNRSTSLPWTRLGVGSPVVVLSEADAGSAGIRGVVCERSEHLLRVAIAEPLGDEDGVYRVVLSNDETSRQRQRSILDRTRTAARDRLAELRGVLLGESPPTFDPPIPWTPLNIALNDSQKEAIDRALSARDLAIIHGPPGTGKTTAVVELIRQAVLRGDKVLACAPSNMAVDNLLERLVAAGERAVRLGHPARVLPTLQEHTLDLMVEAHSDMRLARKFSKEAYALFRKAGKFTRARPEPGARRDMRQEGRSLLTEARRLESQAVEWVLDSATVLCSTTTGLDSEVLGQRRFNLAVIDEAAQSTEPGCWIPLSRCDRVVLAGDHCQLPPTVLSRDAVAEGYSVSMLERLGDLYGPQITRLLKVQYRMNEAIMTFSSSEFYNLELEAHPSVATRRLCDLSGVRAIPLTEEPVHFIDTAGAGFDDQVEPNGSSRLNPEEARLVAEKVQTLLQAGLEPTEIAVIAPYSAQVRLLREQLSMPGLEVDSVDGFQGREKEAVVISLVRSNREGDIGFLADVRRMNVALTRARRLLVVVGDSATLACHPFYQRLLTYFEELGAYHTVWEEAP
ncbi:MAG TPA: AAA domain-containing protein [Gemmataceae bacterium]|jgi:superfamily I DNA and/or RNA helicase|nr:AAA domain-containing protein [Gemmataceae bacterium]